MTSSPSSPSLGDPPTFTSPQHNDEDDDGDGIDTDAMQRGQHDDETHNDINSECGRDIPCLVQLPKRTFHLV